MPVNEAASDHCVQIETGKNHPVSSVLKSDQNDLPPETTLWSAHNAPDFVPHSFLQNMRTVPAPRRHNSLPDDREFHKTDRLLWNLRKDIP